MLKVREIAEKFRHAVSDVYIFLLIIMYVEIQLQRKNLILWHRSLWNPFSTDIQEKKYGRKKSNF